MTLTGGAGDDLFGVAMTALDLLFNWLERRGERRYLVARTSAGIGLALLKGDDTSIDHWLVWPGAGAAVELVESKFRRAFIDFDGRRYWASGSAAAAARAMLGDKRAVGVAGFSPAA